MSTLLVIEKDMLAQRQESTLIKLSRAGLLLLMYLQMPYIYTSTQVLPLAVGSSGTTRLTLTGDRVSYPGGRAAYSCARGGVIVGVQWLVNGTRVEDLNLGDDVVVEFSRAREEGNLVFRNIPAEYNETTIQCRANYSSGNSSTSNTITLLLQGRLSAVGNLIATVIGSTISLTWEAPFFLDIIGIDVTYRVDVINSTSLQVIHSQGGITVTQYNYTTSLSPERRVCDVFKFTITPVNIVGNGSESSITQHYLIYVPSVLSQDAYLINGSFSFYIMMSAVVCKLNVMDISVLNYDDEVITVQDMIVTVNDSDHSIIEITSPSLKLNRHYNITLNVSSSAGSNTINVMLSTHDVQCTNMENSTINIHYVENTKAKGALCILISVRDRHVNFDLSVFIFIQRNEELLISMLRSGKYDILFYDVESNGRLLPGVGYPAYIQKINIIHTGSVFILRSPHLKNCGVIHSNGNILASCEYTSISMASGFQVILQFNDPANVESVHRVEVGETFDRSNSTTISVNRSGTYLATIFAILNETILDEFPSYSNEFIVNIQGTDQIEVSSSSPPSRMDVAQNHLSLGVGIGIAVPMVIAIVLCGTTIFLLHKQYKSNKGTSSLEIKRQNQEFQLDPTAMNSTSSSSRVMYEEMADPPSAFNCTQCPAYETTSEVVKHDYEEVKLYGNFPTQ